MTSIGKAEFPEMTVSEAIEVVEGVKREKAQTTSGLGKVMGLTNVTTGFFYQKVAALSKFYGLIERQKTSFTLTTLAKRIAYPVSDDDRAAASTEVANRVPLFRDLYQALGSEFSDLDFPTKLLTLTGAEHDEVNEKAPKIEKMYRDALRYLAAARTTRPLQDRADFEVGGGTQTGAGGPGMASAELSGITPPPGDAPKIEGKVRTMHGETYYVRVKIDDAAIEELIGVLRALKPTKGQGAKKRLTRAKGGR